jgi:catechol 2,3-dioxygenase-like lactoylglutathione lyase family enzyme
MIKLDHIGIPARDAEASTRFLSEILGLGPAGPEGPDGDMYCLTIAENVSLLFSTADTAPTQHIAFRVDDGSFTAIVDRLRAKGLAYGNDPEDPLTCRPTIRSVKTGECISLTRMVICLRWYPDLGAASRRVCLRKHYAERDSKYRPNDFV